LYILYDDSLGLFMRNQIKRKNRDAETQGKAGKRRKRGEAGKQKSKETEKQRSKEAERQTSRRTQKSRSRQAGKSRKAQKLGTRIQTKSLNGKS
jgi:hypothetical protein